MPTWPLWVGLGGAVVCATWLLMHVFLKTAPMLGLIDTPNARSSHTHPKPRGAGVVMGTVLLLASALWTTVLPWPEGITGFWWLALLLIVAVGFWDDCGHASPWARLGAQGIAVASVIVPLAPWWPDCWYSLGPGVFVPLWAFAAVWAINLMNFMDGSDGLAASENSALMLFGVAVLAATQAWWLAGVCWFTLLVNLVYLRWNWPPARLFMGDSGSTLLGYLQISIALVAQCVHGIPLWLWGIAHALFGVDATLTLIRRALAGEAVLEPHKRHAFQRLLQWGWSHQRLVCAKLVVNALLLGAAGWAFQHPNHLWPVFGVAVGGVLLLYLWVESKQPMFESSNSP